TAEAASRSAADRRRVMGGRAETARRVRRGRATRRRRAALPGLEQRDGARPAPRQRDRGREPSRAGCRVSRALPRVARAPGRASGRARSGGARRRDRAGVDSVRTGRRADRRRGGRLPGRRESKVSEVGMCVLAVGVATAAFKATGPVLLGRRQLPVWLAWPVALLAPAVLAALVVTQAVGADRAIVADARLAGLGAGAAAVALRA